MNHICFRGAVFFVALALMVSMVPCAMGRSLGDTEKTEEKEGKSTSFSVPKEPVLEYVGEYHEGRRKVTDGTLWGYAGVNGDVVIQPRFEKVENFELGTAQVTENGKVGLLRWDGTFLLKPEYDELVEVNCGVYLGRRDNLWDVLSVTSAPNAEDASRLLYTDLADASVYSGSVTQQLVLRGQDGTITRILVNTLPQLLEQSKVDGWQFPLATGRKASFQDVADDDWFDRWVSLAYSVGMMEGIGGGKFEPLRTLTVAETLRMAACLESRAIQDDFHLQSVNGPLWYRSSVTYCEACGVISPGEFGQTDYDRPITRAEMAQIFSATTPVRSMEYMSSLSQIKRSIPDVSVGDFAAEAIFGLYAKGIINGTDKVHSFHPDESLTRAEAAAIVARIARPEQRISFW